MMHSQGIVVAAALGGGAVISWLAVVTAAVVNLPQMLRALSHRDGLADVSGVTYLLIAAGGLLTSMYFRLRLGSGYAVQQDVGGSVRQG